MGIPDAATVGTASGIHDDVAAPVPNVKHEAATRGNTGRTRTGGTWVAVAVALVLLVLLLIFILQNLTGASVYFLGAAGNLPLGVAMLLAAIAGALLVVLVGSTRAMRRHRSAHRQQR